MPQPRSQPPSTAEVVATGSAIGTSPAAAAGAGILVPPAAAAAATQAAVEAAATAAILAAVARFFNRARARTAGDLFARLRQRYPEQTDDDLRRLVAEEIDRERQFQAKMLDRLRRDIPIALRNSDPTQRKARLDAIVAREKRYMIAREQAMAERALGILELRALKRVSPQGAFWTLGLDVKQHTLDCVALSNQFWPWEVLNELHPPLHHGCACHLMSLRDAIANGLMTEKDIPDTHDAIRRARRLYEQAKALEHAAEPEEIYSYLSNLQEAGYKSDLHPRDRMGRWIESTGLRPSVARALVDLLPTKPASPMQARAAGLGQWRWLGGHRVFVPQGRRFGRQMGSSVYASPPGSTNVYKDGRLLTAAERSLARLHVGPFRGTPDPGVLRRIRDHIDDLRRTDAPSANTAVGADRLADHTWNSWGDFTGETNALSVSLANEYHAPMKTGSVTTDEDKFDSSGMTDWAGNIQFGPDVQQAIEAEAKIHTDPALAKKFAALKPGDREYDQRMRALYNVYRVQAHEVTHRVNPATYDSYTDPGGRVLEEGLAEEAGHALLLADLARHGRQDVIDWANAHPNAPEVLGTYRNYRTAINKAFDRAGIPSEQRPGLVAYLKFEVEPQKRIATMVNYGRRYNHGDPPSYDEITSILQKPLDEEPVNRTATGDPGIPRIMGMDNAPVAALRGSTPGGASRIEDPPPDADVAKIKNVAQANAYLRDVLGLKESDLSMPPVHPNPPAKWYQSIVQATKNALVEFPDLKTGQHPLQGVRVLHEDDAAYTGAARVGMGSDWSGVWAYTGPDPRTNGDGGYLGEDVAAGKVANPYVVINPEGTDLTKEHTDMGGSVADEVIYGRYTHELGHAVSMATGLHFTRAKGDREFHWANAYIDLLNEGEMGPGELDQISHYGASDPQEAWAELFTTLNTPGALDREPPETREHLLKMRKIANDFAASRGWGPLL